ncbi:DNA polymerase zeta catalytic subunit [Drechslerella dactyloides]|uniref:DNA polymerase n=1 Tax=Drechslerella dactyloides TaxID=74499 RepID=A0AAD6J4A7_DREDA|nr:DNA polymerase zeta catalytic subunit [Drechslerella dactyloides]
MVVDLLLALAQLGLLRRDPDFQRLDLLGLDELGDVRGDGVQKTLFGDLLKVLETELGKLVSSASRIAEDCVESAPSRCWDSLSMRRMESGSFCDFASSLISSSGDLASAACGGGLEAMMVVVGGGGDVGGGGWWSRLAFRVPMRIAMCAPRPNAAFPGNVTSSSPTTELPSCRPVTPTRFNNPSLTHTSDCLSVYHEALPAMDRKPTAAFRLRLNNVDTYQSTPTRLDYPVILSKSTPAGQKIKATLPIIRVFGATETGQKVCAHVHGAFPYLYVEYTGSLAPDDVTTYIYRLHASIDHALCQIYRRNANDPKNVFVARITLCKGVPFFGFHVGWQYYLKIYLLNPLTTTRVSDLLRSGAVLRTQFQPYEAHLQFIPQWMVDYNLYGCGYINCARVYFRQPLPSEEEAGQAHIYHDGSVGGESVLEEEDFPRTSHCSLEVDIRVQDILNRLDVEPRELHSDFLELRNPTPLDQKLVPSMAELWRDEQRRRKMKDIGVESFGVVFSAATREMHGGWVHEEEYRDRIAELIEMEAAARDRRPRWDTFVRNDERSRMIKTTWETVEDFYPSAEGDEVAQMPPEVFQSASSVDVDEEGIFRADDAQVVPDELADKDEDEDEEDAGDEVLEDGAIEKMEEKLSQTVIPTDDFGDFGVLPLSESWSYVAHDFNIPAELFSMIAPPVRGETGGIEVKGVERPLKLRKLDDGSYEIRTARPIAKAAPKSTPVPSTPRKKPLSQPTQEAPPTPSKRALVEAMFSPRKNGISSSQGSSQGLLPASQGSQGSQGRSSQNSRTSTLKGLKSSFPVVKDGSEETMLRLSQSQEGQKPKGLLSSNYDSQRHLSFPKSSFRDTQSTDATQIVPLATGIEAVFPPRGQLFCLNAVPPGAAELIATLDDYGLPHVIYQDAYYSNEKDVPDRPREYAGKEFRLQSNTVKFLPAFDPDGGDAPVSSALQKQGKKGPRRTRFHRWEFARPPPSRREVEHWLAQEEEAKYTAILESSQEPLYAPTNGFFSQIDGPTQRNKHGFKFSQKKKSDSVDHEVQHMSMMSLEVHINTRGTLLPDPVEDEVVCIFYSFRSSDAEQASQGLQEGLHTGALILSESEFDADRLRKQLTIEVERETTELDLLLALVRVVRDLDPDIITGYEVHNSSWGYLIERARHKYDFNLCDELSRVRVQAHGRFGKEADRWGFTHTSSIRVTGRHLINIWRVMRGELNLLQYTMENVTFHLLHRRIPHYSHRDLTRWYTGDHSSQLARVFRYYVSRVRIDLELMDAQELVMRTSEQARLLGVDFFSVFSRGSQFKVESLMFRIAKPECFVLISPSRKQVGAQNALECLPLVMEPQSNFYTSPLLVLDFQSLYPSVMIAFNYCYSTCLGRVLAWRGGSNKMGFVEYQRQQGLLELLKDHVNIAPNGMIYVKPEVRRSLLAKMLSEILETRVMVKEGMKADKEDKMLQALLNNRQLALKLIANVTYGYTSASFSGRMPCAEIADSIVQSGRETLEKAIELIHATQRWGAEVVYGDTDSLFVYLPGRTKDEAFDIGADIARTVTAINPRPIKLKFEKVYLPCVLLAKKRYVGFKYESKSQTEPEFDAKGIETVRRDGTPAEQKIEEAALKLLFRTADLSQVKEYFQRQCSKIMAEKVSIQDFCFAKEVRLGTYSEKGMLPPGALISAKKMLADHRAEPQYGERVPYVVVSGAPGARLADRCVSPEELLEDSQSRLDAEYYISKNLIPPLERIFNLVGANVRSWYDEMPKIQRLRRITEPPDFRDPNNNNNPQQQVARKATIEAFMKGSACIVCSARDTERGICEACLEDADGSMYNLQSRLARMEKASAGLKKVCWSCAGVGPGEEVACDSLDCPVYYRRVREGTKVRAERAIVEPFLKHLQELDEIDW